MQLGDKIRELRKAKGLTLEQLAAQTESSKGYIWELENRNTRKPSGEKLLKLAETLGVTAEFLLDEKLNSPDDTVLKSAYFRKFEKMRPEDQKRIMDIMDGWTKDTK